MERVVCRWGSTSTRLIKNSPLSLYWVKAIPCCKPQSSFLLDSPHDFVRIWSSSIETTLLSCFHSCQTTMITSGLSPFLCCLSTCLTVGMQAGLSTNPQKLSLFAGSWTGPLASLLDRVTPPARKIHSISRRRNPLKPSLLENDGHKTCQEKTQEIRMCCMVYQAWSQRGQRGGSGRPIFAKLSSVQHCLRTASHMKNLQHSGAQDFHIFFPLCKSDGDHKESLIGWLQEYTLSQRTSKCVDPSHYIAKSHPQPNPKQCFQTV